MPDGTIILNSPAGKGYVTTPANVLLFPALCRPTGDLRAPRPNSPIDHCDDRTTMMPRRRRTRRQDRAHRINTERRLNHLTRTKRQADPTRYSRPAPPDADDDPAPF